MTTDPGAPGAPAARSVTAGPIPAGLNPLGVATHGTSLYVANSSDNTVSIIDLVTKAAQTVPVGPAGLTPWGLAVSPDGLRVYVSNSGTNTVSVIDTTATLPKVSAAFPVGSNPQGLAVTPDGRHLYVADSGANPDPSVPGTVSVVDLTGATPPVSITVGKGPAGVAITPDGRWVYVANSGSDTVTIIDTATNKVATEIPVGKGPLGVAITPSGTQAFVTNHTTPDTGPSNGTVSVIANWAQTPFVTTTFPVGTRPTGITITPDGRTGYVANTGSNTVSVFNVPTTTVTDELPVANSPFWVAVQDDGSAAYVTQSAVTTVAAIPVPFVDTASTWNTDGNHGTNGQFNYLGTRDQQPVIIKTNGVDAMLIKPRSDGGSGGVVTVENGNLTVPGELIATSSNVAVPLRLTGPNAAPDANSQAEFLYLWRPGPSGVMNNLTASLTLGTFESNINGRGRLDINVSGSPGNPNVWGSVPNTTVMSLQGGDGNPGTGGAVGIGTTTPNHRYRLEVDNDSGVAIAGFGSEAGVWAISSVNGNGAYLGDTQNGAYIAGPMNVTGYLMKSGGGFRIDHPHDPAHRYLSHSFVESDEMKNVYDGTVTLDDDSRATVSLPAWFGSINDSFRYQLTAIGAPAPDLHIAEKIADNRFTIAGGSPGLDVCWQVTGVRADAWAQANRIAVETEKQEHERDHFLHPELYAKDEVHRMEHALFHNRTPREAG
jgi:YVTN family beta-propeller protein